tara:strand:+ start:415 stop:909 length:495 start_codon:yes stop_codon:yes gene_type:complete
MLRYNKTYILGWKVLNMGERRCAFDGCNALEFRTTEYCLRHKGNLANNKKSNVTVDSLKEKGSKVGVEGFLFFIGIPISLFGYNLLQAEPVTHWFEGLINPMVQICGMISLAVGVLFILSPIFAKYGYKLDSSSNSEFSFDPSTGMFYLPISQNLSEGQHTSEE